MIKATNVRSLNRTGSNHEIFAMLSKLHTTIIVIFIHYVLMNGHNIYVEQLRFLELIGLKMPHPVF